MKIIILNGLIASGKTTLGKMLVNHFNKQGNKAVFYDLDDLVEKRSPDFKWESKDAQTKDWLESRKELAELSNKSLKQGKIVVVTGPFFQGDEVAGFAKYLDPEAQVFLYTLIIPLTERLKRNNLRKWPNPEEDLKVQQEIFENLEEHFGHNIESSGSEQESLNKLLAAVDKGVGKIVSAHFK